ncbi:MAG: beta-ketoacyl-ACP synthase III [Thermoanaerobaculia bacterium]
MAAESNRSDVATPRAVLTGTGIAIPPVKVTNSQLASVMETDDDWIQERTGIVTRYYVEPGTGSAELGAQAAKAALLSAGIGAEEIDYIILATMTPDHYFPGSGTLLQEKLGIGPRPALDIRQQCAGFVYGLQMVDALIKSRIARKVLLVGADVHSSLIPFSKASWDLVLGLTQERLSAEELEWNNRFRHLVVLFGDGAGAMIFEATFEQNGKGILGSIVCGDGSQKDILFVPGAGSLNRPWVDEEMIRSGKTVPQMDGRRVFKLAVKMMPEVTRQLLEQCGYGLEDLDLLIMHQANLRINEAARKALHLPLGKVHNNISRYGNTTSATLPICFHEAVQAGKAAAGSLVAFTALGAGLHWGSVLIRI